MLGDPGAQLDAVFLEENFVRRVDGKGDAPPFREKSHLDRPVDQLVGDRHLVLSPAVIPFQQRHAVFVCSDQRNNRALAVQIHLHLRVDDQVDGRIRHQVVLIIPESEEKQQAGRRGSNPAADPADRPPGGPFLHQYRVAHRLPDLIVEVRRLEKASLLIQKDHIAGVAFHYNIIHPAAAPFITCIKCPRRISYPLV